MREPRSRGIRSFLRTIGSELSPSTNSRQAFRVRLDTMDPVFRKLFPS
jgi:hypothetical protein